MAIVNKRIIIKNGQIVTGQGVTKKDIMIEGEKILSLGQFKGSDDDQLIDAENCLVFPGAIDTHVHLNDEFMGTLSVHDYYTGTLAAAYGGVTSIVDFSNQAKREPLINTIERKRQEAKGMALVDWGVHPVITEPDMDIEEGIRSVVEAGSPTIKCYMTYREEGLLIEPDQLRVILRNLKDNNGMLMVHAEENDPIEKNIKKMLNDNRGQAIYHAKSRPAGTENNAMDICFSLAKEVGGKVFIVHMSSADRIKQLKKASNEGTPIFAETCTHYLIFTDDYLKREDGIKWICSPPLRGKENQDKLWQGIRDGQILMVTSDDAAYSWEAKQFGSARFDKCPNGIPGIETRFSILYSEGVSQGRISLEKFVSLVAEEPARLFGLEEKKGSIREGLDADLIIFDPDEEWVMGEKTLHMATDWSAYEDIKIKGKIKKVFSRGELLIDGEECLGEKGRGQYLHRKLNF